MTMTILQLNVRTMANHSKKSLPFLVLEHPQSISITATLIRHLTTKNGFIIVFDRLTLTAKIEIYYLTGQVVHQTNIQDAGALDFQKTGFYIVVIPTLDYRAKVQLH